MLVLSIFPGIDLLGRAFEEEGFCIVRGPDVLWGGDVRAFHPPAGVFDGVIGGPPCKCFSPINYINRARGRQPKHPNLIPEFERVVGEARPAWFLMENVPQAPEPAIEGFVVKSLLLNNRWLAEMPEQHRKRRFSFGSPNGAPLASFIDVAIFENPSMEYAVTGHGGGIAGLKYDRGGTTRPRNNEAMIRAAKRPVSRLLELQGLPPTYLDLAPFTSDAKRNVVGNGVPLPMGRAIAKAVKRAMYS